MGFLLGSLEGFLQSSVSLLSYVVVSHVGFLILPQAQPKSLHLNAFCIKVIANTNVFLGF